MFFNKGTIFVNDPLSRTLTHFASAVREGAGSLDLNFNVFCLSRSQFNIFFPLKHRAVKCS